MAHAGVMGGVGFGVGQSLGTSLPVASALPRLVQETEIQKLLTDERIRSEQHKTNYQQLKAEHSRSVCMYGHNMHVHAFVNEGELCVFVCV